MGGGTAAALQNKDAARTEGRGEATETERKGTTDGRRMWKEKPVRQKWKASDLLHEPCR